MSWSHAVEGLVLVYDIVGGKWTRPAAWIWVAACVFVEC
jgi:hypothetical protein